jgi:PadR family transcriptional regulator, regulatory protein PadR
MIRERIVSGFRLTQPAFKVLRFLLDQRQPCSGAEIGKATGVFSGTLYPMLMRMEKSGWLESRWEEVDPSNVGRPRRRFYELTATGQNEAVRAFAELQINVKELSWALL